MKSLWTKVLFLVFCISSLEASLSYEVKYHGLDDQAALKAVKSSAQLSTLKKKPPDSVGAIRYRAESDIPQILKVLHAYGYYEAMVNMQVEESSSKVVVNVTIYPGPAYTLENFHVELYTDTKDHPTLCKDIALKNLGIALHDPIRAQKIIDAEAKIGEILASCGYPLSAIEKREVLADGDNKSVKVNIEVRTGPLSRFGPVDIQGNTAVKELFFKQKIEWKEKSIYTRDDVINTQTALMDTGLFSSIIITHGNTISADGELPMHIEVTESKHSSVNAGISYQTYYGPGITFGWEARNISGMGRRLSLQGDVTKRSHTGVGTYLIPNFGRIEQDLVWQAMAMHESINPYSERTYNITNRVERRINKKLRLSAGVEGERLYVTSSAQNGNYWLVEFPLYIGLNASNSLLNPTKGYNFEYTGHPSFNLTDGADFYFSNVFSFSCYLPVNKSHSVVLAQMCTIGALGSDSLQEVPLSKRFFGGSEEDLRGYSYYTVSPLGDHNKPIGGRSEIFYTLETRFRITKTIGLVPFFDLGNVYKHPLPTFRGKWLKSVGLGVRYFSFMGPFRLDVGFPLDPRSGLDKKYRILLSVGQTF